MNVKKSSYELVVCHYDEDLSWIGRLGLAGNATVYSKGPNPPVGSIVLPNVGRDTHAYAWHMAERHDSLADRTGFVQGNPFDHVLVPFDEQAGGTQPFQIVFNKSHRSSGDHRWTGSSGCGGRAGEWTIAATDLRAMAEVVLGFPLPQKFRYAWGIQFCVSRGCVLSRPREHYRRLESLISVPQAKVGGNIYSDYEVGVMYELLWPTMFAPNQAVGHEVPMA